MLDPNEQLASGATYTFHFSEGGLAALLEVIDPFALADYINAHDANFAGATVVKTGVASGWTAGSLPSGVDVQFTYAGQGSNAAAAGGELQAVIQQKYKGLVYLGADGGATNPADAPQNPPPSAGPSTASLWWIGGAILLGLGLLLALKVLPEDFISGKVKA
jgi:hypothetical protein